MRIRTDSWWDAGRKRAVLLAAVPDPLRDEATDWDPVWLEFLRTPENEARPGDVWVLRQQPGDASLRSWRNDPEVADWPVTGYGLVCPDEGCDAGVHCWDHASDCPGRYKGGFCKNGGPSCWRWTGTPEDDTLTGEPSLLIRGESTCGWHGHLRSGQMVSV